MARGYLDLYDSRLAWLRAVLKGKYVQLATPDHVCNHQHKPVPTESQEDSCLVEDTPHLRGYGTLHILPPLSTWVTIILILIIRGSMAAMLSFDHLLTYSLVR